MSLLDIPQSPYIALLQKRKLHTFPKHVLYICKQCCKLAEVRELLMLPYIGETYVHISVSCKLRDLLWTTSLCALQLEFVKIHSVTRHGYIHQNFTLSFPCQMRRLDFMFICEITWNLAL